MNLHMRIYGRTKYASMITDYPIFSRRGLCPRLEENVIKEGIERGECSGVGTLYMARDQVEASGSIGTPPA
jgi:hypothetical protein